ncbi:MAG TPA: CBS domain-containing protein [Saprospiraceae bacterium]|nr:CBS domain-containing protein [Saprospiraceae bacterium]
MGEQRVFGLNDPQKRRAFSKRLLDDMRAMEYMLENDWFETDTMRIGAEQEMVLVDKETFRPALIAEKVLKDMAAYKWMGSELAKFNLETNLTPRVFAGSCFSEMEAENLEQQRITNHILDAYGATTVLTGILPTLRKNDLNIKNLMPIKRYKALMEAIAEQLRRSHFELSLSGIDELKIAHDSPMLEAVNTSFQVHLQVRPKDFAKLYNMALALTGPVIAMAANSPMVFGKRLWHESRIAMFQQAIDTRKSSTHMREYSPRVHFGTGWLEKSILEIYREDVARFRSLLAAEAEEDSIAKIKANEIPNLDALQVHNSTVYRWNRPCYGISDTNKPHLRIENRVIPAGPSVADETANAAFWLGAMMGLSETMDDVTQNMSFADTRDNFTKAARYGMDSKFTWFGDAKFTSKDLILNELLPLAKAGLVKQNVATADIDRYLGIVEERIQKHATGARWQLRSYTKLLEEVTEDEALATITCCMIDHQKAQLPLPEWELPSPDDMKMYHPGNLKVREFMTTDMVTVRSGDLVELSAEIMNWSKLRYLPVEDKDGHLVGLITSRLLLKYFAQKGKMMESPDAINKDIMLKNPITTSPDTMILEAIKIMREKGIGSLPVVNGSELLGIITEMNFLQITGRLIERLAAKE